MREQEVHIPVHIRRFRQRRHPVVSRLHGDVREGGRAFSILARRWARRQRWKLVFIGVGLVLSFLMMVWGTWAWLAWEDVKAAQLGDLVGGFAGGLGFLGMVAALWMQTRELRLQRLDLRLTRKEMEAQTRVLDAQAKATTLNTELMRADLLAKTIPKIHLGATVHGVLRDATVDVLMINDGGGRALLNSVLLGTNMGDLSHLGAAARSLLWELLPAAQVWPEESDKLDRVKESMPFIHVQPLVPVGPTPDLVAVDPGEQLPLLRFGMDLSQAPERRDWQSWSLRIVARYYANIKHEEAHKHAELTITLGDVAGNANLVDGESEHPLPE